MKPHTLDPAYPQRRQAPFVLEPSERPLYGSTAAIEALPAQRLTGGSRSALIPTPGGYNRAGVFLASVSQKLQVGSDGKAVFATQE